MAKLALICAALTFIFLSINSLLFTVWFASLLFEGQLQLYTFKNPTLLTVNLLNFIFISTTCYLCNIPKAATQTFNRLFIAFNLIMAINLVALILAILTYEGNKIERWYICLESLTISFCGVATCTWVSTKKDGW